MSLDNINTSVVDAHKLNVDPRIDGVKIISKDGESDVRKRKIIAYQNFAKQLIALDNSQHRGDEHVHLPWVGLNTQDCINFLIRSDTKTEVDNHDTDEVDDGDICNKDSAEGGEEFQVPVKLTKS